MNSRLALRMIKRRTERFKQHVQRQNYLSFVNGNKPTSIFDKSKVVYRDGDNT